MTRAVGQKPTALLIVTIRVNIGIEQFQLYHQFTKYVFSQFFTIFVYNPRPPDNILQSASQSMVWDISNKFVKHLIKIFRNTDRLHNFRSGTVIFLNICFSPGLIGKPFITKLTELGQHNTIVRFPTPLANGGSNIATAGAHTITDLLRCKFDMRGRFDRIAVVNASFQCRMHYGRWEPESEED